MKDRIISYIKLLRVKQYCKNLFVFIPLLVKLDAITIPDFFKSLSAFFSFSFVASSVYILNDIFDLQKDRLHPEKKKRPLAANEIKEKHAFLMNVLLLTLGFILTFAFNSDGYFLLTSYVILNISYTAVLKHIPVVDLLVVTVGFILRILLGSFAIQAELSVWLICSVFFLCFLLVSAKRRQDLLLFLHGKVQVRKVLRHYGLNFFNVLIIGISIFLVMSYLMFTAEQMKVNNFFYITCIWLVIGLGRYMLLIFSGVNCGSPTNILFRDRIVLSSVVLWIITIGATQLWFQGPVPG